MTLEVGCFYKIVIEVRDRLLTFNAVITPTDDEDRISFTDIKSKSYSYRKINVFSTEKISQEEFERIKEEYLNRINNGGDNGQH